MRNESQELNQAEIANGLDELRTMVAEIPLVPDVISKEVIDNKKDLIEDLELLIESLEVAKAKARWIISNVLE